MTECEVYPPCVGLRTDTDDGLVWSASLVAGPGWAGRDVATLPVVDRGVFACTKGHDSGFAEARVRGVGSKTRSP